MNADSACAQGQNLKRAPAMLHDDTTGIIHDNGDDGHDDADVVVEAGAQILSL